MELSNALFAPNGKATEAFPTPAARTAFCKTAEYNQTLALMNRLPSPAVKEVSLNQLCVSKLVALDYAKTEEELPFMTWEDAAVALSGLGCSWWAAYPFS